MAVTDGRVFSRLCEEGEEALRKCDYPTAIRAFTEAGFCATTPDELSRLTHVNDRLAFAQFIDALPAEAQHDPNRLCQLGSEAFWEKGASSHARYYFEAERNECSKRAKQLDDVLSARIRELPIRHDDDQLVVYDFDDRPSVFLREPTKQ